jgi:NAD-dependent deacetylase
VLAQMEQAGFLKAVITQNIDMLHQKAGTRKLIEVHGSPLWHHCFECGHAATFEVICRLLTHDVVARCERCGGAYKPDITFFGEMLPEAAMSEAVELAEQADLMIVLGSSLTVHPAAALPLQTLQAGGKLVIVNAQPTPLDRRAAVCCKDLAEFAAIATRLLQAN